MSTIPFPHPHLVLDTSVVIKWYRQGEVLAEQALLPREAYLRGESAVSVPSPLVYELADVLHDKNDLSTGQVQEAVRSLLALNLHLFPPDNLLMCQAVQIAHTYQTTVCDATFAALAQVLPASFVTADEQLARRLSGLSFVHPLTDVGVSRTPRKKTASSEAPGLRSEAARPGSLIRLPQKNPHVSNQSISPPQSYVRLSLRF